MQVSKILVVVHPHFFALPSKSFFDRQTESEGFINGIGLDEIEVSVSDALVKKRVVDKYYRSIIEEAVNQTEKLVVIISGCTQIGTPESELLESADLLFSRMISQKDRLRMAFVFSRFQARLIDWSNRFQNEIVVDDDSESDPDSIGQRLVENTAIRFDGLLDEVHVEVLGETYDVCVEDALRSMQSAGVTNSFALQVRCPA